MGFGTFIKEGEQATSNEQQQKLLKGSSDGMIETVNQDEAGELTSTNNQNN